MKSKRLQTLLLLFTILLLSVVIYSNSIEVPFQFDGVTRIKNNFDIRMRNLSFESMKKAAFGPKSVQGRPFGNLTFAFNYYFHRYEFTGYHVINILIHMLSGMFLFFFIEKTTLLSSRQKIAENSVVIAFFEHFVMDRPPPAHTVCYLYRSKIQQSLRHVLHPVNVVVC